MVVPELLKPVNTIFGSDSAGKALWNFATQMDAPMARKDLGLMEADLDRASELATKNPY